jgi:pilus assembly protein Flp/PilA
MRALAASFVTDDSGATAIEYGLLAAGIAVALTTSINQLGCQLTNLYGNLASSVQAR